MTVQPFPLYDILEKRAKANTALPMDEIAICTTITDLPTQHTKIIAALIYHHDLLENGEPFEVTSYGGQTFQNKLGIVYTLMQLPQRLRCIIAHYLLWAGGITGDMEKEAKEEKEEKKSKKATRETKEAGKEMEDTNPNVKPKGKKSKKAKEKFEEVVPVPVARTETTTTGTMEDGEMKKADDVETTREPEKTPVKDVPLKKPKKSKLILKKPKKENL